MSHTETLVLILDDEPHIVSALRRAIARGWRAGGTVTVLGFSSPTDALGELMQRTVDVVISDYRMPGMDGAEFLRRARDLQPHAGRILLSGSPDFAGLLKAVNEAAASRVMLKPWIDEELVHAVQSCAEMRKLLLENAELADQVRVSKGQLSSDEAAQRHNAGMHPGITEVECAEVAEADVPSALAPLAPH